MDFNSIKILHEINKYPDLVDSDIILKKVNLPKDDFIEILYNLKSNGYIKLPGDAMVESTNKGKTFILNIILSWIFNNLIAILALILAILK